MKALSITLAAVLLSQVAFAQNLIERQFSQYLDREDVAQVHVSGKMFEMASEIEADQDAEKWNEFRAFARTVSSLDLIAVHEVSDPRAAYQGALRKLETAFEELMTVKEDHGTFSFHVIEANGLVEELTMIGHKKGELLILSLTGQMRLQDLYRMARHIDVATAEPVRKLSEQGMEDLKVYPNPAEAGQALMIEVPESLIGGEAILHGLRGEQLRRQPIEATPLKLSTQGLASGIYTLELRKEGVRINEKFVIK